MIVIKLQIDCDGNRIVYDVADDYHVGEVPQFVSDDYTGFAYDANGNLTADPTRQITSITYQPDMNLPKRINFANGNQMQWSYSTDGTKRMSQTRTKYITLIPKANGDTIQRVNYYLHTERFYGDFVKIDNSRWRVYHPTGHVDITSQGVQTWMYYVRDRLGSTRAVITEQGVPLQATDYYPSGIPVETFTAGNAYNTTDRLHTGKEFHAFDGLSWHDNAARFHDTLFPRFTTVDPLAEKDPGTSPYAYCGNNPLRFIDPSGMYLLVTGDAKDEAVSQLQSYVSEGVKLKIGQSGIVSFKSSVKPTNDDIKLLNVLNDPDILVSLNTTTDNITENGDFFGGGAFMGNEVANDPNANIKVVTHQTVNPKVLGLADSIDDKPGTMIMHEITESYEGGKIAMEKGQSTPPAKKEYLEDPNSVYNQAHKRATRQLNVSPVYYDKNENITPNKNEAERVEWVAKGSKGSKVIQEMH